MEPNGLCQLSLRDLARLLGTRELSAREVMAAHLEQIRHWNPHLNAIVAKLDDEAVSRSPRRPTGVSRAARRPERCTACRGHSRIWNR